MAVILHEMTTGEAAERLSSQLPGHRVEILKGSIIVTPPPDGPHQETLFDVGYEFRRVGGWEAGFKAVAGIGLWLPTGRDDYAIPDLSIVDADYRDAVVEKNCYAPHVFHLVLEVTSSNWGNDLATKVETYAEARIPEYVIVDRKHGQVLVYADPEGDEYRTCSTYKRGMSLALAPALGVSLDLSVDRLLDGDED
ncbi:MULTISPECIES: Uma2 family endonuclease [unclassified Streptomyces]|uniref:Uma2 family endonuclease n=1 Tax=unclassified Streptomyces TaxID=2593676 RepID=UPI003327AAA7